MNLLDMINSSLEMGQFVNPKITVIERRIGESVSLPCQVPIGYPPPVVTWQTLKETQLEYIKETSRLSIDIDGKFIIFSLRRHSLRFVCSITVIVASS